MLKKTKAEVLLSVTEKEDKMLVSSVYDRFLKSYEKSYSCFTDFLDERQIKLIIRLFGFLKDELVFFGGIDESERKIATIKNENLYIPIKIIKIKKLSDINHRDVLGSLMSLGIKRQKIGDIVISDFIYVSVKDEISDYILENFAKIRHYNIEPFLAEDEDIKKEQEFIDLGTTVSSLRLDGIISAFLNLSREKSKELIVSGRVNLNHFPETNNRKLLNVGDIISIKGSGRFLLSQINGTTKKDRIRIVISKYK